MINTVCGTVEAVLDTRVQVTVDRKAACAGCQASGVCYSFAKTRMDLSLPRPQEPVEIGDRVIIAMEGSSVLKASFFAFMIPLVFVITVLFVTQAADSPVWFQAAGAVLAFLASMRVVKFLGRGIEEPRIIEVIHGQE
ncbi:MAG: SoxR reducing system RseC family protein [Desulfomonilia bacterium]|jgi:positive regulator of sigma E activity